MIKVGQVRLTESRVERNNSGREFHPLKSSAFHGALFRQPDSLAARLCPVYFCGERLWHC